MTGALAWRVWGEEGGGTDGDGRGVESEIARASESWLHQECHWT